ncbi:hypothetical protein DPMN_168277 [Dreissena polymorpha]|uniref:Uncharacterized protein n=1 Tax=Dreissena polymorpha TaxID=45954 RepID=A0A9D4F650_DREPO|nr:hypothetical protein DPMN_168277 [Dreissena polymorpha]
MEWSAATAMHELLITNTILPLHTHFGEDHQFFQAGWSSGNPKFIEPLFLAAKGNAEDDNAEDDYDKDEDADEGTLLKHFQDMAPDGRTERRTDGQRQNNIPPPMAGG